MKKFLFFMILISQSLMARELYFCQDNLGSIPTLAGGRVKPTMVMASETLKYITGKTSYEELSSVQTLCLLSMQAFGIQTGIDLPIMVEHRDTKKAIGLEDDQKSFPASEIESYLMPLRMAYAKEKMSTPIKKDIGKVLTRIELYKGWVTGAAWTFADFSSGKLEWVSFDIFISKDKLAGLGEKGPSSLNTLLMDTQDAYIKNVGDDFKLEITLVKSNIFTWSMLVSILALVLLVLIKKPAIGIGLTVLTVLMQIFGMTMRVLISGRAPITNMYETVMFSGFGALVLALIIYGYKKDKLFIIGGLGYNILCLFMMKFAGGMLDSAISPLVPVLRDNFWLSTHVTTIILSYAALALSWMLANIVLIKNSFFTLDLKDKKYYDDLIYTCMKYGVIMLSAGIILGGVWADYSWGRFWGWDPKETWSLIVLLIYVAILHGKYTAWINEKNFAMFSAAAFLSVMMAWFGVNYILATGLHSYGFSEGGAIFLGCFFLAQIIIIIISRFKFNSKTA